MGTLKVPSANHWLLLYCGKFSEILQEAIYTSQENLSATFLQSLYTGPPKGGQGGDNDPGPMEFRGPMGLKGPMIGPNGLYRAHGNGRSKTFFRFFGNHLKTPKKIVPF